MGGVTCRKFAGFHFAKAERVERCSVTTFVCGCVVPVARFFYLNLTQWSSFYVLIWCLTTVFCTINFTFSTFASPSLPRLAFACTKIKAIRKAHIFT